MITLGSHLAQIKTPRAAVMPYTIKNGEMYFLLAVDKRSKDLTDLGGGVRKTEYSLDACLREFKEETNEIFGELYDFANDKALDIALINSNQATLFIPVSGDWHQKAPKSFKRIRYSRVFEKRKSHNEVSRLVWVTQDEFKELLSDENQKMWKRLKEFYDKGFTETFLEILKARISEICYDNE